MTVSASWRVDGSTEQAAREALREQVSRAQVPWDVSTPARHRLTASVRYRSLDAFRIAEFRVSGVGGERSSSASGESSGQFVGVLVNLAGHLTCRYVDGAVVTLDRNDVLLWDTERARGFTATGHAHDLSLLVPRAGVPKALLQVVQRGTAPLRAGAGSGLIAVAAQQLRSTTDELDYLSDRQLAVACTSVMDMLDAAVAAADETGRPSARASLVGRVTRYVEEHLDEPDLSPKTVASAHGISVRTLHLAFAETGTTIGRLIHEKRLEASYRDLLRASTGVTVTDIAYRWGFSDAAHFSRRFKLAFGLPPSRLLGSKDTASALMHA